MLRHLCVWADPFSQPHPALCLSASRRRNICGFYLREAFPFRPSAGSPSARLTLIQRRVSQAGRLFEGKLNRRIL